MYDELEKSLSDLISFPLKNQVKVDFDQENKLFRLSAPIYLCWETIPLSIQKYVEARSGIVFLPHRTSFQQRDVNKVELVQEISFQWGFQPTLRKQIVAFSHLAKRCHQMMVEIALEEKLDLHRGSFEG